MFINKKGQLQSSSPHQPFANDNELRMQNETNLKKKTQKIK